LHGFVTRIRQQTDYCAQLAIHLDGYFQLFFASQVRIKARPGVAKERTGAAGFVPELGSKVRSEGRQQENQ
jgi:hypothetical protein